ncbi:hypothetical protein BGZ76_007112 [Entomortierella beljakovae]|nr:hypothetical protein BGZ76_007112 [Entomortierella beljakovae]
MTGVHHRFFHNKTNTKTPENHHTDGAVSIAAALVSTTNPLVKTVLITPSDDTETITERGQEHASQVHLQIKDKHMEGFQMNLGTNPEWERGRFLHTSKTGKRSSSHESQAPNPIHPKILEPYTPHYPRESQKPRTLNRSANSSRSSSPSHHPHKGDYQQNRHVHTSETHGSAIKTSHRLFSSKKGSIARSKSPNHSGGSSQHDTEMEKTQNRTQKRHIELKNFGRSS